METTTDNPAETVSSIPLTQNAYAIVDTEILRQLILYRWELSEYKKFRYARRHVGSKTIYMHRVIMNAPYGMQVDHINGNGLDNRRVNLRICNASQNQQNQRIRRCTSSRFKGVYLHTLSKKWIARICVKGKLKHLGTYNIESYAAMAYDVKAVELFGEFANLNFPYLKAKLISEKKQNEDAGLSEFSNNRYCSDNN